MKITRQYFRLGPGQLTVMAFIKANPLERIGLRRHARAKTHNLRPSHNWPGLRVNGSTFIMRAKGKANVDRGPRPGYSIFTEKLLKQEHSGFELWSVGFGMALMQHSWWVGLPVCVLGVVVPRLLERRRHKRWGQG